MSRRRESWPLSLVLAGVLWLGGSVPVWAAAANTVTGIFAIPLNIQEVGNAEGPAADISLGLLIGLGAAVVRTAVGLAELVTFPFPMPRSGYEPILQPEFLFEPGNPH